jgi:hypothetical protein
MISDNEKRVLKYAQRFRSENDLYQKVVKVETLKGLFTQKNPSHFFAHSL